MKLLTLLLTGLLVSTSAIAVDSGNSQRAKATDSTVAAKLPVFSPLPDFEKLPSVKASYSKMGEIGVTWPNGDYKKPMSYSLRDSDETVFKIDGKIVKLKGKVTKDKYNLVIANEFQYNGFVITLKDTATTAGWVLIIDGKGFHKEIDQLHNGNIQNYE